jgi:PKHD-type hydroxylase
MITVIPDILTPEEIRRLEDAIMAAALQDGALTAGWHARDVKKNLQLVRGMAGYEPAEQLARGALARSAHFQAAVRPRFYHALIFNRYDEGMRYGHHVDDAVMRLQANPPLAMRSDVAFTLFLSDPARYQGGELVIDSGNVGQAFKLAPGALVAYPAGTIHRVNPVLAGTRLAAIGWIQSEVRGAEHRAILYDLDTARRELFRTSGKTETFDLLTKVHANLLRLWAEL